MITRLLRYIWHSLQYHLHYSFRSVNQNIITSVKNWTILIVDFLPVAKKRRKLYQLKNGDKYLVRLHSHDISVINEMYLFDGYQLTELHLPLKSRVIDIGAHIGSFAVRIASLFPTAKIYAFEPFPENFQFLTENIKLNRYQKRIIPFQLGVGGRIGEGNLHISNHNSGAHSLYGNSSISTKIRITSLKSIFDKQKIKICHLLKLDCEGAEYEILYNLPRKYLKCINKIILEYHTNGKIDELKKYLENQGFSIRMGEEFFPVFFAEKYQFRKD